MSPNPQPAPDVGGTHQPPHPALTVVPRQPWPEPSRRRSPSKLDTEQRIEIKTVMLRCLTAQKPEHAGLLATQGITSDFVASLLDRARAIASLEAGSIDRAPRNQAPTLTLLTSLHGLQSPSRQIDQERSQHLKGEDRQASRAELDRSAQAIIHKANQRRGPGVNTDVIVRAQGELAAIEQARQSQQDERLTAQSLRTQTAAEVEAIKADCRKILFAADRAWPHTIPENAAIRVKFQLPRRHVYKLWAF